MSKLITRYGGLIASFGLFITKINVNTTCFFIANQPKLPKDAEKLRKI